jgi:hypothetical protein
MLEVAQTTGSDLNMQLYYETQMYQHEKQMRELENHEATIALFDTTLNDPLGWPDDDYAVKQDFNFNSLRPFHVIKTGWSTTLFLAEFGDKKMHDVEDAMSRESEDSGEDTEHDEYQKIEMIDSVSLFPLCI